MLSLIWKDLIIQKKSWLTVAILPIFMLVAFSNMPAAALVAGALAVAYVLIVGVCVYDEKNKSDLLWCSLPVQRKTIVGAKYLSALTFMVIGIIVVAAYGLILEGIGLPIPIKIITFNEILGIFVTTTFFMSFYFPIYFKFGYARSRYFGIFIYVLMFMAPQILIQELKDNARLATLFQTIGGFSLPMAAVFVLVISYLVSMSVYQKKDIS